MSGLLGTLDVALQSLLTQQAALRTTTDNLGNLSSEGYSRRRPVITEQLPIREGNLLLGRGAVLSSVQSIRDRVLELRISGEEQEAGAQTAFLNSMAAVETQFGNGSNNLGSRIQSFFNRLSQLASFPTDSSLRQGVLIEAANLAQTFHDLRASLQTQFTQADQSVRQAVDEVNRLTDQIAAINVEVASRLKLGQDAGTLEDQRTSLLHELSQKIDISVTESPDGLTLSTVNGEPLVVAGQAYTLKSITDSSTGSQHVYAGNNDLTADLTGGELGGVLLARDGQIRPLTVTLDQFAFDFASAMNQAHQAGFDLSGTLGAPLFSVPSSAAGTASAIALAIDDPAKLAASGDGSAGSNGALLNMIALKDTAIVNGMSPAEAYSAIVFQVGSVIANARSDQDAGSVVMEQLKNLRGSISGVSLDEESANLIRFQQAYQAAARVVSTINEMLNAAVNLGKN